VTRAGGRLRARAAAGVLAMAALLAAGGCGGSAGTSAGGSTTTAASTAEPTAPATTAAEPARPGSAAAGKRVFLATCGGCHAGGGTRAAFGPKIAGRGRSEAYVRETVTNGRGQMPAGLVEGQDLEDIVAYVLSIE
jgi:cytochrome c551